ncbi:hypothetical protein B0H16DRAFT_1876738 [Mycena metata]|uniref:Serine-threonine/tyrosine-protein kinase catalytic domain-containing protein n=1 Tax=Mycena metata TaxID=1033252 RepID=A0AAD7KEV3_9AGAR|nr:hypothetical protein B0H16DRAFT_1876738 [Mycena metata]
MSFISNADNFTLGEGTYINVLGSYHVHNNNRTKRRRDEIEGTSSWSYIPYELDALLLTDPLDKRPRLDEGAASGLKIGSGPGYLLHAARNKTRAVTVKVFNNSDSTARQQLESAVTLCKQLMHPNVLRMKGISSSISLSQFIVYEDVPRKNAKGPLATALQSRTRSLQLGFKMVADLSAGLDYLSRQGISLAVMRAENFDVFLDVDDRFLIIINANSSADADAPNSHESQEDNSWALFNGLCDKVLVSANRVLHTEEFSRDAVLLPSASPASQKSDSSSVSIGLSTSQDEQEDAVVGSVGDPRREYVWRAMDRGKQSLATVTDHMTTHLDIALGRLQRLTQTDRRRVHRCRGYMREEITLAPTIVDSAVVSHDTPRPLEICSICHEIVGWDEVFRCICGERAPGSRYTVKCTVCKFWSHRDCVANVQTDFTCQFCEGEVPTDNEDEPENSFVMREAQVLDKAMEERILARKISALSVASSSSGVGIGEDMIIGPLSLRPNVKSDAEDEYNSSVSARSATSRASSSNDSVSSKRYSNNLFGSGRFRDYSYMRSNSSRTHTASYDSMSPVTPDANPTSPTPFIPEAVSCALLP